MVVVIVIMVIAAATAVIAIEHLPHAENSSKCFMYKAQRSGSSPLERKRVE